MDEASVVLSGYGAMATDWSASPELRAVLTSQWELASLVGKGDARHRHQHARNLEDAAKSESRIRADHLGRYPVELLQNAQDACADAGRRGAVWFRVTDTALLVANQGIAFTPDRVESLIRLGGTTKAPGDPRHHTIGYKGIGFTSVFEVSSCPQIISSGIAFGLDQDRAKTRLSEILQLSIRHAPARYFPFSVSPSDWRDDAAVVMELFTAGAVTVIRLPFREHWTAEKISNGIREALSPSTLLLMPAIDRLDLGDIGVWQRQRGRKIAGGQLHHVRQQNGQVASWLVRQTRIPVSSEVVRSLEDEVWSEVNSLHVLIAIPWRGGRPDAREKPPRIHAYFPTDDSIGRSVLVHGDFFLESNRRRVQSKQAGGAISDLVAQGAVDLVRESVIALAGEMPSALPPLIECLAEQEPPQGFGQQIAARLDEALANTRFLPTLAGSVVTPREAMILGVDMPERRASTFARMLHSVDGLLEPDVECAARSWLARLGATTLASSTVAAAVDAAAARSYDDAVLAFASWWKAKPRWSEHHVLDEAKIVRSNRGAWQTATDLCEPVPGVPPLPVGLQKATYESPKSKEATDFVADALKIQQLTASNAVEILVDALRSGSFGRNDMERESAHAFARAVFRSNPSAITSNIGCGCIPVPVRTWRRGHGGGWRRADEVYLSADWTGHNDLERLYRRFADREFLAVPRPKGRRAAKEGERFYRALGVSSEPGHALAKAGSGRLLPSGLVWARWKRLSVVPTVTLAPHEIFDPL